MGFQVRVTNRSISLILRRPRRRLKVMKKNAIKCDTLHDERSTYTHRRLLPLRLFANMM